MTHISPQRRYRAIALAATAAAAIGGAHLCLAAPNLVANGDFDLPRQLATARLDPTETEAIFEIPGPEGFGRVVIRSPNAQRFAQKARIGYAQIPGGPRGLAVDTKDVDVNGAFDVAIWFDLKGQIHPNREYTYAVECRPTEQGQLPVLEMIAPAMWADGKFLGSSVQLEWPNQIKTYDDLPKRGVVKTANFKHQTGGQSLILKLPKSFKGNLFIDRVSFREIDEAALKGQTPRMPMPVRYMAVDDILEEQIEEVLTRTPEALKAARGADGHWGNEGNAVEVTALILGELAERGEDLTTKDNQKAITWLVAQDTDSTQALAARLWFLCRQRLLDHRQRIAGDITKLLEAQYEDGGWSASAAKDVHKDKKIHPDNSMTSNAIWGLKEAYYAGFKIEVSAWRKAADYFRNAQAHDGGFRATLDKYGGLSEATTTHNTAEGLCGLYSTLDMSFAAGAKQCTQYLASSAHIAAMNNAIEWLNRYYDEYYKKLPTLDADPDPLANAAAMTTLIQLSGISRLRDKDVFRTEAEYLVRAFDPQSGLFAGSHLTSTICLEILAQGASPVVFQRLILGGADEYHFSRDVEHLVRYLNGERKRTVNWVEADIEQSVRELVAVPVLYAHAAGAVELPPADWKKLRQYCFAGGVMVFNVAEDNAEAREKIVAGLKEAFPEYALSDLPADDPILTIKHKLAAIPGVKVLGNGLKHFVYLMPEDWSCRLNTYQLSEHPETFQFFENLLDYTLDSETPRNRFAASTWAQPTAPVGEQTVARIEVGGGVPAYPDLLDAFDRSFQEEYRVKLKAAAAKDVDKASLLWVSGNGAKPLSAEDKKSLEDAMSKNVFVFVEVLSGDSSWGETLRSELLKISPDIRIRTLPGNHPVYTGQFDETFGYDLRTLPVRKALREKYKKLPRLPLEVIEKNGKEVGLFSPGDISSGLGYVQYPNCKGPMPEAARQFSSNLMLYAMQRRLPAQP